MVAIATAIIVHGTASYVQEIDVAFSKLASYSS